MSEDYHQPRAVNRLYKAWIGNNCPKKGVAVDMRDWFCDLEVRISLKMIGSKIYCSENSDHGRREAEKREKLVRSWFSLFGVYMLSDVIPVPGWLDLGGYEKSITKTRKELDVMVTEWLDELKQRRRSPTPKNEEDVMEVMLGMAGEITDWDADTIVQATYLNMLVGGTDTRTVGLTWTLSLLLDHARVLNKAREEVDLHIRKDRWATESDVKNLSYLHAVIKESMRRYPPAAINGLRISMEDCTLSNGYHITARTRLMINIWKMQRDERMLSNLNDFHPERFLTTHRDIDLKAGQDSDLTPFGMGRRVCPGMSLALYDCRYVPLGNELGDENLFAVVDTATQEADPIGIKQGHTHFHPTPTARRKMFTWDLSLPKTQTLFPSPFLNPLLKTLTLHFPPTNSSPRRIILSPLLDVQSFAGRSKKNPGGNKSSGRIEGDAAFRRRVKQRSRSTYIKVPVDDFFTHLKQPGSKPPNHADNFTEDELRMIGKGYDRWVRFLEKDDPRLRHPHDWYKYGEYGPYSWRGVVIGDPVRGTMRDEGITLMGEVKDQEEWERIEEFELSADFGKRLDEMDESVGFWYYWVFVRHPKWRLNEKPWEQWTLVSEVVVEASKDERLDKWNLMGRLGNKARRLVTRCAAWRRPDIIYVKRPVYQCRFEPQDDFFQALLPFLDPRTENKFMMEHEGEECTYFSGLCRILQVSEKSYVDDVMKKFEKSTDEKKSECLGFLLENHPVQLLHPWTREWKAKMEELELGCDAPDEEEEDRLRHRKQDSNDEDNDESEIVDWVEEYDDDPDHDDDEEENEVNEEVNEEEYEEEDDMDKILDNLEHEDEGQEVSVEDRLREASRDPRKMEALVKRSIKATNKMYEKQFMKEEYEKELEMRGKRAKVDPKEWEVVGIGRWNRRIRKTKIPPELFLRAAVRPFTYANLVKEIVLTRHAIVDGDMEPIHDE